LRSDKSLIVVAALASNRAIGLDGRMPWRLPDELEYFKRITLGKPVIMGRKTREAIGMALPGRQNIVISRNPAFSATDCETASSLEQAIELARGPELMIIGGGQLYRLALPHAKRMALTIVNCEPEADTWFPEWRAADWELIQTDHHPADERHKYSFEMQNWVRISA
jgi:dihydrofolate reductase